MTNRPLKKLWEICSLITKWTTPTTYWYSFLNKGITFVKVENMADWRINHNSIDKFIWQDAHDSQKRSQLEEWDILFSIAWTIWNTAIVKKEDLPANINQAIAIIRWFAKNATPEFMRTILSSQVAELLRKKARWWALQNISLTDIKDFEIPLPPLATQQLIVAKLDEAFAQIDEAITTTQANIVQTDELTKSVLDKVFEEGEWERKKIGDKNVITLVMWQSPSSETYNKEGIWLPFFQWKKEFWEVYPVVEQYCSKPVKIAEVWDILMSVRAPVWPTNLADQKCCIWRWLWAIRPNKDKLITSYLLYFLKKFEKNITALWKGSTFSAITKSDLENVEIPLPPLAKQQEIVSYLDHTFAQSSQLKEQYQKKLVELKELKASVLQSAFEGKLV